MNKPNGYDETKATGEFIPVELGGHHATIKQVSEKTSSTGKPMIVILFDFDQTDKQPDYFSKQFAGDDRADKKWPFSGSKYILVNDYQDATKTSKNFKTFCTCVEKSNGFQISWGGSNWGAQFKGKRIGVVYGEEEQEYDGKTSMRRVPKWFCEYQNAESSQIPRPKYLKKAGTAIQTDSQGFMALPNAVEEEEIPF